MTSRPSRRMSRGLLATAGLTVSAATALALVNSSASASPLPTLDSGSHLSAGPATTHGRKVVATKPAWTTKAKRVGTPASSTRHQLVVTLKTDQAAATAYAKSVSDPTSPNYRKFLTPAQFAERFGASKATVSAAEKWLTTQGFTVRSVDASHTSLTVTGPTTAVNKAFGAKLGTFKHDGSTVTAPTAAASVPASTPIAYVVGMDTTPRNHTNHISRSQLSAKMMQRIAKKHGVTLPNDVTPAADTVSGTGCSHYWGEQIRPYQTANPAPFTNPLPSATCGFTPKALNKVQKVDKVKQTGKGVTVGITMWCGASTLVSDTNHWSKDMGLPTLKSGQVKIVEPTAPYNEYCEYNGASDYTEVALDVQAIHSAAPAAKIVYSAATDPNDAPLLDALHRLIDDNGVDIVSDSWGGQESLLDDTTKAAYDQVFTQAAAQGITVLFSSGDSGDGGAGDGSFPPAPNFPASDPWITSVGGTNIGTTKNGSMAFESGWMTSEASEGDNVWGGWYYSYGAGGGISKLFAQPYYQKGVVPVKFSGSTPMRSYPDLSNLADPATGFLIGYTDTNGNYMTGSIGGTSLAAPRTAGQLALAIQQAGGRRLGFINPVIYSQGAKHLTDLQSNKASNAYLTFADFGSIFGFPPIPEVVVLNSQSLINQTLTLQKGYDNLSGVGAVDNQSQLMKLVNGK